MRVCTGDELHGETWGCKKQLKIIKLYQVKIFCKSLPAMKRQKPNLTMVLTPVVRMWWGNCLPRTE